MGMAFLEAVSSTGAHASQAPPTWTRASPCSCEFRKGSPDVGLGTRYGEGCCDQVGSPGVGLRTWQESRAVAMRGVSICGDSVQSPQKKCRNGS